MYKMFIIIIIISSLLDIGLLEATMKEYKKQKKITVTIFFPEFGMRVIEHVGTSASNGYSFHELTFFSLPVMGRSKGCYVC